MNLGGELGSAFLTDMTGLQAGFALSQILRTAGGYGRIPTHRGRVRTEEHEDRVIPALGAKEGGLCGTGRATPREVVVP